MYTLIEYITQRYVILFVNNELVIDNICLFGQETSIHTFVHISIYYLNRTDFMDVYGISYLQGIL
jgi:hypothetical protein